MEHDVLVRSTGNFGTNGISEKVVQFSRRNFPTEIICVPFFLGISRLYHQFYTFRGLLSGQDSLEWNL